MDDYTLLMTMLFDFYSDLLTEKQKEYFDLYHNEDFTLAEIAEKNGISRQGAYDIITRAEKTLKNIEQKTGLVKKWNDARIEIENADEIVRKLLDSMKKNQLFSEMGVELVLKLAAILDNLKEI